MFLTKSPNNDLTATNNYAKITPECYRVYLGMAGSSVTLNFANFVSAGGYGSATIFISTGADVEVVNIVSGAILSCGHGGLRFIAYNSDTSIEYSINSYELTIKSGAYPYGQWAYIKIFNENSHYTYWPY